MSTYLVDICDVDAFLASGHEMLQNRSITTRSESGPFTRNQSIFAALGDELNEKTTFGSVPGPSLGWDVARFLGSVGLSTVKSWGLPFHVLSNGQQMRCQLAMLLIQFSKAMFRESNAVFVVPCFDSILDNANVLSMSTGLCKAIQKMRTATNALALTSRPSLVIGVSDCDSQFVRIGEKIIVRTSSSASFTAVHNDIQPLTIQYTWPATQLSLDNGSKAHNIAASATFAPPVDFSLL